MLPREYFYIRNYKNIVNVQSKVLNVRYFFLLLENV